ncbi:MAG: hypothetical protein E6I25_05900 [Chloroflexi bacterium]|nr:MAG: hypothetical protein E6I25_05900 [Chloroflexota bacterium]
MTAAERGIRRRQRLFVVFTAVLVLAYARQLVNAPTAGQDFRAFFAAATVAAQGGDPYDWTALGHIEDALYNTPAHVRAGDPTYYDFLPYPEGPWLALALEPLTGLSWQTVYPVFAALMLLAIAIGSWLILARLGWPARRLRIAVVVATISPIAFRGRLVPRLARKTDGRRVGVDARLDQAEPWGGLARRGGAPRASRRAPAADQLRGRQRAGLRRRGPGASRGSHSLAV